MFNRFLVFVLRHKTRQEVLLNLYRQEHKPSFLIKSIRNNEISFSEYCYQKWRFSNTLSWVEILKTEIYRIRDAMFGRRYFKIRWKKSPLSKISWYAWRLNTIQKRYIWTQMFLNAEKNSPFLKIPDYVWTGPDALLHLSRNIMPRVS